MKYENPVSKKKNCTWLPESETLRKQCRVWHGFYCVSDGLPFLEAGSRHVVLPACKNDPSVHDSAEDAGSRKSTTPLDPASLRSQVAELLVP